MIKEYVYDLERDEICEERDEIDILDYMTPIFYDIREFHEYHKKFAEEVVRLGVTNNGRMLGYCYLGMKEGSFRMPYSSPFSLIYLRDGYKVNDALHFIEGLKRFAEKRGVKKINVTLAPDIYGRELVSVLAASLFSQGFSIKINNLNNYYDLSNFVSVEEHINKSVHKIQKNFKRAVKSNLVFEELNLDEFETAYDVIKINREQMGYPLKISKAQMNDLIKMDSLTVRAFIVKKEEIAIAAAIIFDMTNDISQVVYWGDIPEYRNERVMDFMPIKIFEAYKKLGKRYLDIGPSSEDGIINAGLAEFKQALGCSTNCKLSFEYIAD